MNLKEKEINKDINHYKTTFKATALFGGVEITRTIVGLIQTKIVALLLGSTGIGIQSLFTNSINLINSIVGLGLRTTAVREIATANASKNQTVISITVLTVRRWVASMGVIGALVTLILSPYLSQWTFGSKEFTWGFVWASIVIFTNSISNGQLAQLQGMRKLLYLAKSSTYGSFFSLIISIPMYYYFGMRGVVLSIITGAICTFFFSMYYSRKIKIENEYITYSESYKKGIGMVKAGFFLMLTGFGSILFIYLTNTYLVRVGGLDQVGLYRAGFLITTQYVSLVFSSMGTDYFPRLSQAQNDFVKTKAIVNQQGEIAILLITPLVVSLISFAPFIIKLLYTTKFICIIDFISIAILAMLFRASSWCMSYILLANNRAFLFFIVEILTGFVLLCLNIFFYNLIGLVY